MINSRRRYNNYKHIFTLCTNIGAAQYIRQMLTSMKGEINNNTIIVEDFNTPHTPLDRSTKQKISKETQILNDTMISIGHFTQNSEFHLFSQVHTEPCPG